jgi:hypothetical protein
VGGKGGGGESKLLQPGIGVGGFVVVVVVVAVGVVRTSSRLSEVPSEASEVPEIYLYGNFILTGTIQNRD